MWKLTFVYIPPLRNLCTWVPRALVACMHCMHVCSHTFIRNFTNSRLTVKVNIAQTNNSSYHHEFEEILECTNSLTFIHESINIRMNANRRKCHLPVFFYNQYVMFCSQFMQKEEWHRYILHRHTTSYVQCAALTNATCFWANNLLNHSSTNAQIKFYNYYRKNTHTQKNHRHFIG